MTRSIPRRALAFLFSAVMIFAALFATLVTTASSADAQTVTNGTGWTDRNRVQNSGYSDAPVLVCDEFGGCKTVHVGQTANADLASMPAKVAIAPGGVAMARLVHPNGYVQPWQTTYAGQNGDWVHADNLMRYFGCYTGCIVQVVYDSPHLSCFGDINAGCVHNIDSDENLIVCQSWSGTAADPDCAIGSPQYQMRPNTWSVYNDTDGFYVPAGRDAMLESTAGSLMRIWETGWHKVGNAQNHTVYFVDNTALG